MDYLFLPFLVPSRHPVIRNRDHAVKVPSRAELATELAFERASWACSIARNLVLQRGLSNPDRALQPLDGIVEAILKKMKNP